MKKSARKRKKMMIFRSLLILLLVLTALVVFIWSRDYRSPSIESGVTFSHTYAEALGLSWKEVYLALLNDLGVKKIRLIAYWPAIETEEGVYDFRDLAWQIDQAEAAGAEVILAIGRRLPRWPECHEPSWTLGRDEKTIHEATLSYMEATIAEFQDEPIITAWQVENEPFLSVFGECPQLDVDHLAKEVVLVQNMDQRPILITDSGELSLWLKPAAFADIFGTTLYRIVWNENIGYFHHILPKSFYYWRSKTVRSLFGVQKVIVSELQGEPWIPSGYVMNASFAEQMKSMPLSQMEDNYNFARGAGFDEVYWWGAEWWYWMKQQGKAEFWEKARELIGK